MVFKQLDSDDIEATGTRNELVEVSELIEQTYGAVSSPLDMTRANIISTLEGEGSELSFIVVCSEVALLCDIYVPIEEFVDALDELWATQQNAAQEESSEVEPEPDDSSLPVLDGDELDLDDDVVADEDGLEPETLIEEDGGLEVEIL